ncbi:MAG: hypothetical protein ACR2H3_09900 [Acidimicrobiales bacterium]
MSLSEWPVSLRTCDPFECDHFANDAAPPWAPPVAEVAHVSTERVVFDEAVVDPFAALDWCRTLLANEDERDAAFVLDEYRNVSAAWFSDDDRAETVLTLALSADIRSLAGRELVVMSAVDVLDPATTDDRQRFRRMVKKAKRRNAVLLDWVLADASCGRSLRLAVNPGNGWPQCKPLC